METLSGTGEEYTCDNCGAVHEKTWSDEEAMAEMTATWQPHKGADDLAVICDDCFQAIIGRVRQEAPELLR